MAATAVKIASVKRTPVARAHERVKKKSRGLGRGSEEVRHTMFEEVFQPSGSAGYIYLTAVGAPRVNFWCHRVP